MQPFDYLNTSIKSYIRVSKLQGIGLFALVDIKKGENVFPIWKGETGWYKIKFSEAKKLPIAVLQYILRSFGSEIINDDSIVKVVKREGISAVWLVPIIALFFGGYLVLKTYMEKGVMITILLLWRSRVNSD